MKRICVVVLMVALLSVVSPAFALIQAFRLGAVGQDSITGTKGVSTQTAGNNHYMTFESPVGTDYQVTAGYTFYITRILFRAGTAGAALVLGYGDDGVAAGAAAPTNFVQITGVFGAKDNTGTYPYDILFSVPAGKYPCMKAQQATNVDVMIFGVEIAD